MKKTLTLILTFALALCLSGPAAAGKKKPKGPKPYKSEEVTITLGHSILHGASGSVVGVTGQEFINNCAIPSSNGFDAYVWEVPDEYKNIDANISSFGSGGPAGYDLDIVLFDESCAIIFASQSDNADEATVMFKGTAFILIYNFGAADSPVGGGAQGTARFELKPYSR